MPTKSSTIFAASTASLDAAGKAALLAVRGDPTALHEAAIRAACLLLVTKGAAASTSASEVNRLMPEGQWFRSDWDLWEVTGGKPEIIRRLAAGGVIPSGSLGKWTPDFWAGLTASGALMRMNRPAQWAARRVGKRPYLLLALQGDVPFARSWAKCRRWTAFWGMWSASMGADNPTGIGVLAGLLAGGRRVERKGESWIGIAWRASNTVVLDHHRIPWKGVGRVGNGTILISPFWGALLGREMPDAFRQWFELWIVKAQGMVPGMCPLLPWAFIAYAWGKQPGPARVYVPLAVRSEVMYDRGLGIGFRRVRRDAFVKLGVSGVGPEVRAAWLRGLAEQGITEDDFPPGKVPLDFKG